MRGERASDGEGETWESERGAPPTRPKELFLELLELAPAERADRLARSCGTNVALRSAVEKLLAAHARADSLERLATSSRGARGEIGARLGPYVLRDQLGEGGFGIVYLAEQEEPVRRRVALKVIKPGMDTRAILARFEAERQALARMDHPGICKVHDAGTTEDGRPYFVMELFEGVSIVRYCEEHALPLSERLRLFGAVCEAVQHAHHKGVVHRDLKPSNVLVATIDGRPSPKVIDFGIAKAIDPSLSGAAGLTLEGQCLGTPAYMSPEQAAGSGDVDTQSDVYGLGALLYEMLCGQPPFDLGEAALVETLRRIREEDPPRPSRRGATRGAAPGIPDELDWIVMRCLQKERARRYPTAWSLRADIERFLAHRPVEAAPPSHLYALRKLARRHRLLVASVASVAVAIVAGAVLAGVGLREAELANRELAGALGRVEEQAREALRQGRICEAVIDFLNDDLFAAAQPSAEAGRGHDVRVREVLDEAARRLDAGAGERFASEPAVEARLRATIGGVYLRLWLSAEAEPQLRRALELEERLHGKSAPSTLRAATALATALRRLGRGAESEALLERFARLGATSFAVADADTLLALRELALLRQREGRHAAAAQLFEGLLQRTRELLGAQAPELGELRNALAVSSAALGRAEQAERLFRSEHERRAAELGPEHPVAIAAALNLGAFLLERGRLAEAEELLVPAARACAQVFGPLHAHSVAARIDLSILRREQGRLEEAAELLEEALALFGDGLASDPLEGLQLLLHRARLHEASGELAQAEALLLELCERSARSLGEAHPLHGSARSDLAALWFQTGGRDEELGELLRAILATEREQRGDAHPSALRAMANLAAWCRRMGQLDEAEGLLVRALELGRASVGPEDPSTLRTLSDLSLIHAERGRPAEALALAEEAAVGGARVLDEGSYELAVLRLRHGAALLALDRLAEAEAVLLRAQQVLARLRPASDPLLRAAERGLADLCERSGRAADAWRRSASVVATAERR